MIPSEAAACFLPLKRLKTPTVWVLPAARLKIPNIQAARSARLLSWQHHCSSPQPVFIEIRPGSVKLIDFRNLLSREPVLLGGPRVCWLVGPRADESRSIS